MMLFPIQAKYLIWILGGIELLTLVSEPGGALASVGALGGVLGGWVYLKTPQITHFFAFLDLLRPKKQKFKANHLRLVKDFEGNSTSPKGSVSHSGPSGLSGDDKPKLWH
jgi:hypothetical protein